MKGLDWQYSENFDIQIKILLLKANVDCDIKHIQY